MSPCYPLLLASRPLDGSPTSRSEENFFLAAGLPDIIPLRTDFHSLGSYSCLSDDLAKLVEAVVLSFDDPQTGEWMYSWIIVNPAADSRINWSTYLQDLLERPDAQPMMFGNVGVIMSQQLGLSPQSFNPAATHMGSAWLRFLDAAKLNTAPSQALE